MRRGLVIGACAAAALAACGGQTDTAGGEDADWIEVPLPEGVFATPQSAYRTDVIAIPVPADERGLEYKLAMREGDAVTYQWRVDGVAIAALFQSEFHGHTEAPPGEPGTLMFYRKAVGLSESGSLVAPFDGIHGWWFLNSSDADAVVELTVSGFYELVEDG